MRTVVIAAAIFLVGMSQAANAVTQGCASRGGPGWRDPKGDCAGWNKFPTQCGFPPEKKCSFEGAQYAHSVPPGATREIWEKLRSLFHLMGDKLKRPTSGQPV